MALFKQIELITRVNGNDTLADDCIFITHDFFRKKKVDYRRRFCFFNALASIITGVPTAEFIGWRGAGTYFRFHHRGRVFLAQMGYLYTHYPREMPYLTQAAHFVYRITEQSDPHTVFIDSSLGAHTDVQRLIDLYEETMYG